MHHRAAPRFALGLTATFIALTIAGCSGSDTADAPTATPTTTVPAATTPPTAGTATTVAKSSGDGTRPTIVSFTVTPAIDAPCKDGHVQATMTWEVTPASATVTIKDIGTFATGTPGDEVGPYANSASNVAVPASIKCDGTEYNLSLTATNGGAAFVGRTATVASATP